MFVYKSHLTLNNLTCQNGRVSGGGNSARGGGLHALYSQIDTNYVTFESNQATGWGGAIYISGVLQGQGTSELKNVICKNNSGSAGSNGLNVLQEGLSKAQAGDL